MTDRTIKRLTDALEAVADFNGLTREEIQHRERALRPLIQQAMEARAIMLSAVIRMPAKNARCA